MKTFDILRAPFVKCSTYSILPYRQGFFAFSIILLAALVIVSHVEAQEDRKGFGASLGYGSLRVGSFMDIPTDVSIRNENNIEDWPVFVVTTGYSFNNRKSELTLDWFWSQSGHETVTGTQPLLGGGTTKVYRSMRHAGWFLGFREQLISRLFINGGVGFISQDVTYSYGRAEGGSAFGESYGAWFWGVDLKIFRGFLLGFKIYRTEGSPEKVPLGGRDTRMKAVTFHLTYL